MSTPQSQLREYNAKRDFTKTAEPAGKRSAKKRTKALTFVVQKHDATRLHYDFRLELDGVLKSWAVTKGPSANPADRRLAVRVEDHPLEYGGFEGTIPKGEYGGGTVMLWDEGTWEPIGDPHEGLKKGDLKFRLKGKRMKGEWVLVHMKGRDTRRRGGEARENWLLIKHRDDDATKADGLTEKFTTSIETGRNLEGIAKGLRSRKRASKESSGTRVWTRSGEVKLPEFRPPQLATLVDEVPEGDGWLFETKYDGYRALAAIAGGEVRIYTRNGLDWSERFSSLVAPLGKLTKGSALIDGEIAAMKNGRADFATMQDAMRSGAALTFFAFDLLEVDGESIERMPLVERKARLKKLLGRQDGPAVHYSDHIVGHGDKVLAALCEAGQEGVIAKLADAPYRHERTKTWLKIKCLQRQELVIGGWRPSDKHKGFASLLLGTWEDGKLVYRGRVGTGFDAESAAKLQKLLDSRARKTNPFENAPRDITRRAKWVSPELVAEVEYTEMTPDLRLRHPSFIGLREDKPAKSVKLEVPSSSPQPARRATKAGGPRNMKAMELTDEMGIAAAEKLGVKLSSPDRVVYPDEGITKAKLVAYYAAVAERMLQYVGERPLSLVRAPGGLKGQQFFQKHDAGNFPDAVRKIAIEEKSEPGTTKDHMYVTNAAGLAALVQMNTLEFHIWGATIRNVEKAERIIFDIDPDEGLDFRAVREAAMDIRDRLSEWGLESFPMVTGGKGIHVIAPVRAITEWPLVKDFCHAFADRLEMTQPERYTSNIRKAKRKGRMFVDYLRNERGSTAIGPFSTRARKGCPVAVPVGWDEIETMDRANGFTLETAAARALEKDPWVGYEKLTQSITKGMVEAVAGPINVKK
jgi:bifunctional non-homologous end joining protein LigD